MKSDAAAPRVWGVRELLNYIARQFRFDARLQDLGVRGEVTDLFTASASGHLYFALKEPSGALLRCFARNTTARGFPALQNGMEAIAYGALATFESRSQIQLLVADLQLVGSGALAAVYERIKRKLEAEGLFDPARKRTIPRYPFRVALVSSRDAEGANDFLGIVREAKVIAVRIFPTLVQGGSAPEAIVYALQRAGKSRADVIVLARGGGSDEDRLPFNDEFVARAIAGSPIPVVTAIGHRGDHHVADDVADYEAATPTAAAELLVAHFKAADGVLRAARERTRVVVEGRIQRCGTHLRGLAQSPYLQRFERLTDARAQRCDAALAQVSARHSAVIHRKAQQLRALELRLAPADPRARLAERGGRIVALAQALETSWQNGRAHRDRDLHDARRGLVPAYRATLQQAASRLAVLRARLDGKDPEAILERGYAIVRSEGRIVRDAATLRAGATIDAQLSRGTVRARVEETQRDG
jgi:exodeoxyribonuclease VII large subunit